MTELTRFARRLIKFQSPAFNFERASVTLLSTLKQHQLQGNIPPMSSEWRDPPAFRIYPTNSQGARHG